MQRTISHCHIQNIKAVGPVVSEKKIFLVFSYCRSMETIDPRGVAKGLGSIDAVFGLIFKMADVTRYDSTRFGNYKNGVFNSLHGWLPWQRAYFEDYCFETIRHVSLRC